MKSPSATMKLQPTLRITKSRVSSHKLTLFLEMLRKMCEQGDRGRGFQWCLLEGFIKVKDECRAAYRCNGSSKTEYSKQSGERPKCFKVPDCCCEDIVHERLTTKSMNCGWPV